MELKKERRNRMLQIKFTKNEPGTVCVGDLIAGSVFKVQRGTTPYMILGLPNWMTLRKPKGRVIVVSLASGDMHLFSETHPVVELDGTLELSRIV